MISEQLVREALKEVYDPELQYSVVDLGLIYDVQVNDGNVHVLMTLTSPGCPVAPMIIDQIQESVGVIPGAKDVDVEITFDPPWGPESMSEDARADLGLD
jgi:metal-sulfur cluster biosynthetic enzyme